MFGLFLQTFSTDKTVGFHFQCVGPVSSEAVGAVLGDGPRPLIEGRCPVVVGCPEGEDTTAIWSGSVQK